MPSMVGNIKIVSIGSAGVVEFGDTLQNRPYSTTKTFTGAGSFNTGDLAGTANFISNTNSMDSDLMDQNQPVAGNGGVI